MSLLSISPNIPRIYTAIAEWLSCVICLLKVKHRVSTRKLILIAAGTLFLQSTFLSLTPGLDDFLWILCMSAAGLMMYTFIYLCADINWKDAAYYTIRAFVIAEFVASCEWQVDLFFSTQQNTPYTINQHTDPDRLLWNSFYHMRTLISPLSVKGTAP